MRCFVRGDTELASTKAGPAVVPLPRSAGPRQAAKERATSTALEGGTADMTRSLRRATSSSDGTTMKSAAAARLCVASLRPERHVMAVPPERTMASPRAAPSPPGYRMHMGLILLLRGFGSARRAKPWQQPRSELRDTVAQGDEGRDRIPLLEKRKHIGLTQISDPLVES